MNKQNPYLDAFNALQAAHMNKQMNTKLEKLREDAEEKDEKRRLRRSGWGDGPPALITLRTPTFNESMYDLAIKVGKDENK
tara:strand:- start:1452 stop:1694 length:243 start_codon:yes stop_codon:yes gene_type:complete